MGRVFSDRYHARILKTPREVRVALVYTLQNARKHGAWVAVKPDVYSSGPCFDGWRGGLGRAKRFLREARTWLLMIGWRRRGLIDLREAPATTG